MNARLSSCNRALPLAILTLVCVLGALAESLGAGQFNDVLSIGDKAPAWEKLIGVDGKSHALADLKEKEFVLVCFTCNSCPYAVGYEDRLNAFAAKHCGKDGKAALVAINVNVIDEDKLPAMKKRAEAKKFLFPYLFDESQKIAKDFGAVFTPEVYLLDKERRVVYMGALDDNADPAKAKTHHVEQAMAALARGEKPAKTETPAVGCRIRFQRTRKK